MSRVVRVILFAFACGLLAESGLAQDAPVQPQSSVDSNLSMEEAVVIALKRNRDVVAAKLDLK